MALTFIEGAGLGTGKILQVVVEHDSNIQSSTSSTYAVKTNPSPSITTMQLNSKIYIIGHSMNNGGSDFLFLDFARTVAGGSATRVTGETYGQGYVSSSMGRHMTISYLDSPAQAQGTVITYQFMIANEDNSTSVSLGDDTTNSTIAIFEVAI